MISVLSLPQLSFNLIFVSKLTRRLNCNISLFPDYCLIQDLTTKQIIGRGRESGSLYILNLDIPKSVACSGVVTPIRIIMQLGSSFSLSVEEVISLVF